MTNLQNLCLCCSGKEYEACCKTFHQGAIPENALFLMRSRYVAYALNIPDYIVETTHPANSQYSDNKFSWNRSISQFSRCSSFHRLEIFDFQEKASVATVTFTAYISQNDREVTFTERSYFEKIHDRWLYRGGHLAEGRIPDLVPTGPLRLLPLAYYGDPILRKKAAVIPEMTADVRNLVEDMIETMDIWDGIGLAAPQIHHAMRLFVIRKPMENEQGGYEGGEVKVFINPTLSSYSTKTWEVAEGCLSIPSLHTNIERPKEVTIAYTSLEGNRIQERVSGWEARVIQHEYDHIEGILFVDRLDQEEQLQLEPLLQNLEKRFHGGKAFL